MILYDLNIETLKASQQSLSKCFSKKAYSLWQIDGMDAIVFIIVCLTNAILTSFLCIYTYFLFYIENQKGKPKMDSSLFCNFFSNYKTNKHILIRENLHNMEKCKKF